MRRLTLTEFDAMGVVVGVSLTVLLLLLLLVEFGVVWGGLLIWAALLI